MGVEAEFPAFSEGRLGRPWLPAPLRRLWLVRRCVAVGFQGWGCRRHTPLPILAAWWPESLSPVLGAPSHCNFTSALMLYLSLKR